MTKVQIAQTLGELIKMGLVESIVEDDQPTRYRLAGQPEEDATEETPTPRIPAERVHAVEAASVLQIVA